jgi:hypothetical protein
MTYECRSGLLAIHQRHRCAWLPQISIAFTMMNLKQALVALIVLPSMGAAFAPSVRTNVVSAD